ncbi:hypothetical protein A8F94_04730 [Bacillus sp. FJAT-27225]|uniref:DUF3679 domain-containing protein n=1 Tax=Bacillus sp. FJAT-27225 TaxID=1743144 RepID=UPI00080C31CC|nr:DUF3679 domain-containing protein [Bacillus sp. FJAT-27225]OCA91167.1 hypothetical protein A8F94_04730 [Bacillus sp. FJAT-27225]
MKLFMVKSLLLAMFMFSVALAGMQAANNGISRMKGYEDPDFKQPVTIQEEDGVTQVTIMGGEVTHGSLEEKKEQLETTKAVNFFSALGKGLASALSSIAKVIVNSFSG